MTLRKHLLLAVTFLVAVTLPGAAFAKAKITVKNNDSAGEGFNDPTPAAPVGGNTGTTLGAQRLISFQTAADIWSELIDSDIEIVIQANFDPLPCTNDGATLGAAGPRSVANFNKAPMRDVWYPMALASKFAGTDLSNGTYSIQARFNSDIDKGCFNGEKWYYGLDGVHGTNEDLVVTLLHEFGHGLGFSGTTASDTGELAQTRPGIWDFFALDTTTGKLWKDDTSAERVQSTISNGNLVWSGPGTKTAAAKLLTNRPTLVSLTAPASVVRSLTFSTGQFSGPVTAAGIVAPIVQPLDASDSSGVLTTDACSAITNMSAVAGRIALIDRGTCSFVAKTKAAQLAGALAVIIVDNQPDGSAIINMGGTDATITIPAISISHADGEVIKGQLSNAVTGKFVLDPTKVLGLDAQGNILLYAPTTFISGSSVYHFDTSAQPNLLMEPNISSDLVHKVDITLDQLKDIGWTSSATTTNPGTPDLTPTVGRKNIKKHN